MCPVKGIQENQNDPGRLRIQNQKNICQENIKG